MKNPLEVLRVKEAEIERVKREIEALKAVAPLLEENDPTPEDSRKTFAHFS